MFSYDPAIHVPPPADWTDQQRNREVSYIGSPLEDRPQFLRSLAEQHQVPLVIDGPHWQKIFTPELLARYVASGQLMGSAYREAIWKSKINLSFVTHLNEDDIAHKSVEIAACAGFLLTLRCPGHEALFEEDKEAVFFSSVEECAEKIRFYLPRPELRREIGMRARQRAVNSGYDNDTQLTKALNQLDGLQGMSI
jgi:spore maturation protein CgeB